MMTKDTNQRVTICRFCAASHNSACDMDPSLMGKVAAYCENQAYLLNVV